MTTQTFTCCQCHRTYDIENEAESVAEYEHLFGLEFSPSNTVVVCDDCFVEFDKRMESQGHKLPDGTYHHPSIPRKIH